MGVADIIVLIVLVIIIAAIIGVYIYKRVNNLPTGECASCHTRMKKAMKKAIKETKKNKD